MDLSGALITAHAAQQLAKRRIAEAEVRKLLVAPQQVLPVRTGRVVAQSRSGGYILRVFVDVDRSPPEVVTAYRSSKIEKYWSNA
jgi:hypothetical protein